MCGLKSFFKKIGQGFKKAGRWIKDKALPFFGRLAKQVLGVLGMLPGKLGAIGKVGSAVTDVLHNVTEKIPNKDIRDKIDNVINKGSDKVQTVIDKGKGYADTANYSVNTAKDGINNIVKPAIPAVKLNPINMS